MKAQLDPKSRHSFCMASYDLDTFRRFVFDSKFFDVFDINEEEIEKMRTDEIALMKFGVRYLKYVLMMEESLKVKPQGIRGKEGEEIIA